MLSVWLRDVDGQALHSLSRYETILDWLRWYHMWDPVSVIDSSIYKLSSLISPTPSILIGPFFLRMDEGWVASYGWRRSFFVDCARHQTVRCTWIFLRGTYLLCVLSFVAAHHTRRAQAARSKAYNFCGTCSCSTRSSSKAEFRKHIYCSTSANIFVLSNRRTNPCRDDWNWKQRLYGNPEWAATFSS